MSLRSKARGFANRDQWSEGRAHFEDHVARHPDDAEAFAHLAFFVVKESRYDTERGLQLLEQALQLDPTCAVAWVYRGMILGTLQQDAPAFAALDEATRLGALEEDVVRTRAWISLDLWRLDEALAGFHRLVEVCPESSSCVLLSTAYLQAADYGNALIWARQAVYREADDFRGFAYGGVALTYQGRHADARRELEEAVRLCPTSPLVHHTLGYSAFQQGNLIDAERHLRAALQVDPLYVTSRKLLADICASSARTDEARTHYEAALACFPDYTAAREALAALDS